MQNGCVNSDCTMMLDVLTHRIWLERTSCRSFRLARTMYLKGMLMWWVGSWLIGVLQIYNQMPNEKGTTVYALQKKFQAVFGFTLPLFHGRGLFNCTPHSQVTILPVLICTKTI
jgi:hypothetical protein